MLTILFLAITMRAFCPEYREMIIPEGERIQPFERLTYAIGMVESQNQDTSVNRSELAFGRYQIREIRLQDYFERTGIVYTLEEMKDSIKAKRVLLFYCDQFGPYQLDKICLDWNCQSRKYLAKVKKQLNNLTPNQNDRTEKTL